MLKADLRRLMLERRRALPEAEVQRRSLALREQLVQHFSLTDWRWLHLFLPIPHHQEPDTWEIVNWIWEHQLPVSLAVSVVQPDGLNLLHYELAPDTMLRTNRWGIPEPVNAPEVHPQELDAVLVPLLAFDQQGHRVGYGKGFYDRFLQQCRPDALRIGVSLEPPVEKITDSWGGDVTLNACITPEQVWHFNS
ncbi:5-formyltetrahydrofolate cyclo-ligase [Hymenobacter sp. BT730]|uniref:5-formyltetrahydrofolate cyclo-ligase n=1 Tax=Hymenobacter sp. BT730 TaxID=3063332 RepID=UPI0026DFD7AA|nr:5-formyltetrahydrofolate cyclo-ligase [Hymenobacter sp. BT730]